jgi:hypothetical protein
MIFCELTLAIYNTSQEKNRWSRRRPTMKSTSLSRWRLPQVYTTGHSTYSSDCPHWHPARLAGQGTVTTCFKCGEVGHYANACPKRIPNTPARSNVQGKQQTPASGKGFSIARVNQVSADATADEVDIAIGTFYIN